jgi:hypothetical protein
MAMSSEALAWAAGFFEGEGCFFASYYRPREDGSRIYRTSASVTQKDEELLLQFKDIVGFGTVYADGQDDGMYVWKTTQVGQAAKLFDLLHQWLGQRRTNRFHELDAGEAKQILRPLKSHCKNGHPFIEGNYKMRRHANKTSRICSACVKINNDKRINS